MMMIAMHHSSTAAIVWTVMIVLICIGYGACVSIANNSSHNITDLIVSLIPIVNTYWWAYGIVYGTGNILAIICGVLGTLSQSFTAYLLISRYLRGYEELED